MASNSQSIITIPLSDLSELEVLDYVDGPKIYSSVSQTGQVYFCFWIGTDESESDWLYVAVSRDRYAAIKSGRVSLRNAFLSAEDKIVHRVTHQGDGPFLIESIVADELDFELLPLEGDSLNLSSTELATRVVSTSAYSARSRREILDLTLLSGSNATEIKLGVFTSVMHRLQLLVDALGSDQTANVRKISNAVRERNSLVFTEVFGGSFGARLARSRDSLFDEDINDGPLPGLLLLFEATKSFDSIKEELLKYNLISRARFMEFTRRLIKNDVSLKAEYSGIGESARKAEMPLNVSKHIISQLESLKSVTSNETELDGKLVGVDVDTNFFDFVDHGGQRYKGLIAEAIRKNEFTVPHEGTARIIETVTYHPVTGKENFDYELLRWEHEDL